MAWTLSEKDQIREWLAFACIYRFADPQLEGAIDSVQSQADGGSQPDNSTEVRLRGYLEQLAIIDDKIFAALECAGSATVGDITLDPARAIMMMERQQRVLIGRLADALSMAPYRDATTGAEPMPGGHFLGQLRQGWPS